MAGQAVAFHAPSATSRAPRGPATVPAGSPAARCRATDLRYDAGVSRRASALLTLLVAACDGGAVPAAGDASSQDASAAEGGIEGDGTSEPPPEDHDAARPTVQPDGGMPDGGVPSTVGNPCSQDRDCLDGVFCNGSERCLDGTCGKGMPPEVDDGVACTEDRCDESTGRVVHQAQAAMCDDDEPCTRDECDRVAGCRHEQDFSICTCEPVGECDPFDANPCPGAACRPSAGETVCEAIDAPVLAEGDSCAVPNEDACPAGTACIDFGGGQRCHRLCRAGSVGDCGATLACSFAALGDPCLRVCRPFPEACDIFDQDCADSADTCTLATHPETDERYTGCRPAGPQERGDACGGGSGTCGHGLICVSSTCREVCDPMDGTPGCSDSGEACTGLSASYEIPFCQP